MGGPSVTVHIDADFARAYRRALVRERRGRWTVLTAFYAAFGIFAAWQYFDDGYWGMLLSLAIFVGVFVSGETTAMRRDFDLPVGHQLTAEHGDISLLIRRPDRTVEVAYSNFRKLDRVGVLMYLEDGTGDKTRLPSALFTPEAEAWFRQHAHPRDLAAEPLPPEWREMKPEPGLDGRLALAGLLKFELRSWGWPLAIVLAFIAALGVYLSTWFAALMAGFVVAFWAIGLGHEYSILRRRLAFRFAGQAIRSGPEGDTWVVDSVNFRERIDPAAVTYFERRRGLVFLRHTTSGEKRSVVFPEPWLAGLLSSARVHADSI